MQEKRQKCETGTLIPLHGLEPLTLSTGYLYLEPVVQFPEEDLEYQFGILAVGLFYRYIEIECAVISIWTYGKCSLRGFFATNKSISFSQVVSD